MGRFWADPKGAKQGALSRVAAFEKGPTLDCKPRLAENTLLNAAQGNITLKEY